jgi:hypothetical protein
MITNNSKLFCYLYPPLKAPVAEDLLLATMTSVGASLLCELECTPQGKKVRFLSFSPDGTKLAAAGEVARQHFCSA